MSLKTQFEELKASFKKMGKAIPAMFRTKKERVKLHNQVIYATERTILVKAGNDMRRVRILTKKRRLIQVPA